MIRVNTAPFDSILVRTGIILLIGVALAVGLTTVLFHFQRAEALRIVHIAHVGERLSTLVRLIDAVPTEARSDILRQYRSETMHMELGTKPLVLRMAPSVEAHTIANHVLKVLPGHDVRVIRSISPQPFRPGERPDEDGLPETGAQTLWASVELESGIWLNGFVQISPANPPLWRPRLISQLIFSMAVLCAVALLAVWRIARPFRQFAEAADRLGRDVTAPGLPESGPTEFRQAAKAFNLMRERIGRFVEDRTQMIAAISHDLRTPITRLRLRVEFVDDDIERARLVADLDEMERMISATLTFAQDSTVTAERRAVDLATLVQGVVADSAEMGGDVAYGGPERLVIDANVVAIKRALVNLIENAVKYGGKADVELSSDGDDAIVWVKDHGPGIPAFERERVFSPFFRLEESRCRETGGSGLGLSIARAAIRAHGGDIVLSNAEDHGADASGLWVKVTIPC